MAALDDITLYRLAVADAQAGDAPPEALHDVMDRLGFSPADFTADIRALAELQRLRAAHRGVAAEVIAREAERAELEAAVTRLRIAEERLLQIDRFVIEESNLARAVRDLQHRNRRLCLDPYSADPRGRQVGVIGSDLGVRAIFADGSTALLIGV